METPKIKPLNVTREEVVQQGYLRAGPKAKTKAAVLELKSEMKDMRESRSPEMPRKKAAASEIPSSEYSIVKMEPSGPGGQLSSPGSDPSIPAAPGRPPNDHEGLRLSRGECQFLERRCNELLQNHVEDLRPCFDFYHAGVEPRHQFCSTSCCVERF